MDEDKKYVITISDKVAYHIDGRSREEAIELALNWFGERSPKIEIEEEELIVKMPYLNKRKLAKWRKSKEEPR